MRPGVLPDLEGSTGCAIVHPAARHSSRWIAASCSSSSAVRWSARAWSSGLSRGRSDSHACRRMSRDSQADSDKPSISAARRARAREPMSRLTLIFSVDAMPNSVPSGRTIWSDRWARHPARHPAPRVGTTVVPGQAAPASLNPGHSCQSHRVDPGSDRTVQSPDHLEPSPGDTPFGPSLLQLVPVLSANQYVGSVPPDARSIDVGQTVGLVARDRDVDITQKCWVDAMPDNPLIT
jgi:hypothetical protein